MQIFRYFNDWEYIIHIVYLKSLEGCKTDVLAIREFAQHLTFKIPH